MDESAVEALLDDAMGRVWAAQVARSPRLAEERFLVVRAAFRSGYVAGYMHGHLGGHALEELLREDAADA